MKIEVELGGTEVWGVTGEVKNSFLDLFLPGAEPEDRWT